MKKIYLIAFLFCIISVSNAQIVTIPDANFKSKLLQSSSSNMIARNLTGQYFKVDANSDNEIQLSEALNVSYLQLSSDGIGTEIQNLEGINSFANLIYLNCWYNILGNVTINGLSNLKTIDCFESHITSLTLTGLTSLQTLNCYGNQLQSLDLQGLTSLRTLNCSGNQISVLNPSNLANMMTINCGGNPLTGLNLDNLFNLRNLYCQSCGLNSLDTTDLTGLTNLYCTGNNLTSLNLSNSTHLINLDCVNNSISSLNLNGLTSLVTLDCANNQLQALDTSTLNALTRFTCPNNQLQSLDISNMLEITIFNCNNNNLEYLFLKNFRSNYALDFMGNPNLSYVCIDEYLVPWIENTVDYYGYTACEVNSYCSFVPGGIYYEAQGTTKLDVDGLGCDSNDPVYPLLKLGITSGLNSGNYTANTLGNYSIPLQAGTHTITPILENPTYFNVSPTNYQVTFPDQASPVNQNFCVTPNGAHKDLEITIIPLVPARPGFDATYRMIFKNKGTVTQSGTVTLIFDDGRMDFVSATPAITSQATNQLFWDYTDLLPFESRVIVVKLNVNSPLEVPAVNNGDILRLLSLVDPQENDEYQTDNVSGLRQVVVGSMDPNDKTCVEGNTIAPEMAGEYVHYVIRFENTGTYAAENIVVKDMIDLSKFDISTLVPLHSSHSFVTRIAGNKVEFVFENINLPFEDNQNDGYIAFKIKTKPTLVVGDTFTNSASIYFDYNFPVTTNTASTSIQALANPDFEFEDYFKVFPNPANAILNIQVRSGIQLQSINVYNVLGQLVLTYMDASQLNTIDVSNLKTGNYLIRFVTDKGITATKFIKR